MVGKRQQVVPVNEDESAKQARIRGLRKKMKEINIYEHHCKRCGGKWKGRSPSPKICSLCNSPYWNKERVRTNAKATTKMNKHTTANIPVELANGIKQVASDDPDPEYRTMTAQIIKIVKNAGVKEVSEEDFKKWKTQRKVQGKFYLD